MKILIGFFAVICFTNTLLAQTNNCKPKMDSTTVVDYLRTKNLILKSESVTWEQLSETPSLAPKLSFDAKKCQWKVVSVTYGAVTYKGKCTKTNGCTPEIKLTVILDDKTKKVISKKKTTKLHPNYE